MKTYLYSMRKNLKSKMVFALAAMALLGSACHGTETVTAEPPLETQADTTAPTVVSKTPDDNGVLSLGLSKQVEKSIQMTFSEPVTLANLQAIKMTTLEPRTTTTALFITTEALAETSVAVPIELSIDPNDAKVISITASFTDDKKYTVTLEAGSVQDLAGNPNAQTSWSFTAAQAFIPNPEVNPDALTAM